HRAPRLGAVKDIFRPSKSFRFWRQSLALAAAQFHAPTVLAAGELRRFRALPEFLAARLRQGEAAARKRAGIEALARTIRRLHGQGFVHGDLVASNIF